MARERRQLSRREGGGETSALLQKLASGLIPRPQASAVMRHISIMSWAPTKTNVTSYGEWQGSFSPVWEGIDGLAERRRPDGAGQVCVRSFLWTEGRLMHGDSAVPWTHTHLRPRARLLWQQQTGPALETQLDLQMGSVGGWTDWTFSERIVAVKSLDTPN
ncbi:hypothetical protein MHYP_G00287160 [Metynnis hypsauchen]